MERENYNKLYKKAHLVAFRILKKYEDAEDIAQDVIIKYLEFEKKNERQSHQSIDQAVIDCIRTRFGQSGTKRSEFGRRLYFDGARTPEDYDREIAELEYEDDGASREIEELGRFCDDASICLSQKDFVVYCLINDGFVMSEAADVVSVTESRVSQIMKRVKEEFNRIHLFKQRSEFLETERTEMQVDWIRW